MKRTSFLFSAETATAGLHRTFDWDANALGSPDGWDPALKTLVPIMLASNQPMFIAWGESRTLLYNDAYAAILADKHPGALGQDFLEVWGEIREDLQPIVTTAYSGNPVQMDDIELWMERRGYREETHFSFFYTPVRVASDQIGGFFCACNEITSQVLTERRLVQSEARHRGVLENMGEGFVLFDERFTILEVNPATTRMVNLAREDMIGRNHWELFPGTFDGVIGGLYRNVLATGAPGALEHLYRFEDGRACWFEVRAFPVGRGMAVLFRDVTARKKLQEEASASLERIQLALDAGAVVGTWVWQIEEDLFVADERFAASFGLDPVMLRLGAPLSYAVDAIHPDDRLRVQEAIGQALEARGRYRCEYRVLRDGAYRWVEANGRVEVNEEGQASRFPGVLIDIDEHRRVEEERDRAATLLRTFVEAVPGAVYAKDREGRYLLANRGTADTLGLASADIVGQTDAELLGDPHESRDIMARDRGIMESAAPVQVEELVTGADGTPRIWWTTKEPLWNANGQVIGLVGASVDITERKRLEEELRLANTRKDEFLAMLAHELRNPLAPIRTSSHLLKLSAQDPERVRSASEIIARQVGHMTKLVDDLLDVSRVTRGLVQLVHEPVDLRNVVATAFEQVRPLVESRRHELRTRIGAGSFIVQGDFHRLVQVVSNLLNNAAKYTPQAGLIEIALDGRGASAVLTVVDNGLGIDPALIGHVFDLFTQAERTPDRSQGGLGIGLALVRSLVELHGGTAHARSAGPHQGSTFEVILPLSAAQAQAHPVAAAASGTACTRVLVVDDNVDAALTLAEVLRMLGHTVDTAHDGASALATAGGDVLWGAIILDVGLPDMTGYELASRMRGLGSARQATFIALTGYGQAHDRVISRASGFDHHLVKPADVDQLAELLARSPHQEPGRQRQGPAPRRVGVTDD